MKKTRRTALISLSLLLLGSVIAVSLILQLNNYGREADIVFVDDDEKSALAIYLDHRVLRKHDVSIGDFETAYEQHMDAIGRIAGAAVANMFSDETESKTTPEPPMPTRSIISPDGYEELLDTMTVEEWNLRPDGTHVVTKQYSREATN